MAAVIMGVSITLKSIAQLTDSRVRDDFVPSREIKVTIWGFFNSEIMRNLF